jgi:RHS repeat-associated protein
VAGDNVRQQFTSKERDVETNLDYFKARFYSSTMGRFTGVDPYDINIERQHAYGTDEADSVFTDYLSQPKRWNRYVYCQNNPLRNVDPDGRNDEKWKEDTVEILGKTVKVQVSLNIKDEDMRNDIIKKIKDVGILINERAATAETKLTADEIKTIHGVKRFRVYAQGDPGMLGNTFELPAHRVLVSTVESLAADTIHDSYHTKQWNYVCGGGRELPFEQKASVFTLRVIEKLRFGQAQKDVYQRDALTGHQCIKSHKKKF